MEKGQGREGGKPAVLGDEKKTKNKTTIPLPFRSTSLMMIAKRCYPAPCQIMSGFMQEASCLFAAMSVFFTVERELERIASKIRTKDRMKDR